MSETQHSTPVTVGTTPVFNQEVRKDPESFVSPEQNYACGHMLELTFNGETFGWGTSNQHGRFASTVKTRRQAIEYIYPLLGKDVPPMTAAETAGISQHLAGFLDKWWPRIKLAASADASANAGDWLGIAVYHLGYNSTSADIPGVAKYLGANGDFARNMRPAERETKERYITPAFMYTGQVLQRVSPAELTKEGNGRQNLTGQELGVVLQTIHEQILNGTGRAWVAPHAYFSSDGFGKKFGAKTGASLKSRDKLRVILDILCKHGFIKRERVRVPGRRWKMTKYMLGDNPPGSMRDYAGVVDGIIAKKEAAANLKRGYYELSKSRRLAKEQGLDMYVGKGRMKAVERKANQQG